MIDEDREAILNARETVKMGQYIVAEKVALVNEEFGEQMEDNYDRKRRVRNAIAENKRQ